MKDKVIKALKHCLDLPPEDAVKYLESQDIKITWDWQQQLDTIRQHCFTVAKVESADMLQLFYDELNKAMTDGRTYEEFKKSISELLDIRGYTTRADGTAWRLDTIYRTNMQSAYMAGRYLQMDEVKDDFPYWQYIAVMDNRTRPSHARLNGKVVRADDASWSYAYPPNGYLCRCRTRALSEEELKRLGLKVSKRLDLKFQPDDGFDANPAAEWVPDLTKYSSDIKKQLQKVLK